MTERIRVPMEGCGTLWVDVPGTSKWREATEDHLRAAGYVKMPLLGDIEGDIRMVAEEQGVNMSSELVRRIAETILLGIECDPDEGL